MQKGFRVGVVGVVYVLKVVGLCESFRYKIKSTWQKYGCMVFYW